MATAALLVTVLLAGACRQPANPPAGDWRTFAGTWSSSGQRQSLPTGGDRPASIVHLSGPLVLTSGEGLSRGFHTEVIGYEDGSASSLGRCVWIDERGDRIFSELKGEWIATGQRLSGTITGGTGRYAGLIGEYAFEWQYVVDAGDGTIHGRAVGLEGRVRVGEVTP